MNAKKSVTLQVEQLSDRVLPSATASFSNGVLLVRGDNQGDNLLVSADSNGNIQVTERGQAVTITGSTTATLSNTSLVIEESGKGYGNVLATAKSLGSIATYLDATLGHDNIIQPGNPGPSTEVGGHGFNHLYAGPGGKDVMLGGTDRSSQTLFDWEPGTGTDVVIGRGGTNTLLDVGNFNGQGENDEVDADGQGGFIVQRNNLVPYQIDCTDVQYVILQPSTGSNTVTINNLTGVQGLKQIEVDSLGGNDSISFANQQNPDITAVFNGGSGSDTFVLGAGPNKILNYGAQDTVIIPPDSGPVQGLPHHHD